MAFRMTDYEQLARIRNAWPSFLKTIGPANETFPGGAQSIAVGRAETPMCDPIAFRDGILTVAAREKERKKEDAPETPQAWGIKPRDARQ